jgi:uncharacterized membrane protein
MKTLIVGRYDQQTEAENARRELLRAGFAAPEMTLFYVNPQGQHALYPVGGDEDESPGTHEAKSGAARGAAGGAGAGTLLGAATIPVLGPVGPLMGAAVGAYTGSLVGALKNMEEAGDSGHDRSAGEPPPRKAGFMLAVAVVLPAEREAAIEIQGAHAQVVEETEGILLNGDWIDFDPLASSQVIDS